jgi:hypothetical protein
VSKEAGEKTETGLLDETLHEQIHVLTGSQALPGDAIPEALPLGVTGGKASRRAFPARDWE